MGQDVKAICRPIRLRSPDTNPNDPFVLGNSTGAGWRSLDSGVKYEDTLPGSDPDWLNMPLRRDHQDSRSVPSDEVASKLLPPTLFRCLDRASGSLCDDWRRESRRRWRECA